MAAGYNLDYLFVLHAWNISDDTTDNLTIACPVKQDSREACWFLLGKNHNTEPIQAKLLPC